jgi:hypothetical protein
MSPPAAPVMDESGCVPDGPRRSSSGGLTATMVCSCLMGDIAPGALRSAMLRRGGGDLHPPPRDVRTWMDQGSSQQLQGILPTPPNGTGLQLSP